ncbi:bestrophin-like domain [Streptomyces muensis]|uniref:bestrophin-like domain n=1 Tax=Streptomyces muensis TaxID=1077944 RepID=UPI003FD8D4E7
MGRSGVAAAEPGHLCVVASGFLHVPTWAQAVALAGGFLAFGVSGLLARPWIRRRFEDDPEHNDRVTFLVEVVGVFYALLVGLVAVGAYDHYVEVKRLVNQEASQLTTVYRAAQSFPNSRRCRLQSQMRNYAENVIDDVWPKQKQGEIEEDQGRLDAVFESLMFYEPRNAQESNAQSVTLEAFNDYNNLRRERQGEVEIGLLPVLYVVLFLGATVTIAATWALVGVRLVDHLAITGLLSLFIGVFLSLIVALDFPLQDSNSIPPKPWTVALTKGMGVPADGEKQVGTYFGASTADRVPGCLLNVSDYVSFASSEQLPE